MQCACIPCTLRVELLSLDCLTSLTQLTIFQGNNNSHFLYRYANAALDMQMELLFDSWVSLGAMMLLFIHLVLFADYNVWWKKILSGFIHCICHCTAAICAAIMLESIIEVGISR